LSSLAQLCPPENQPDLVAMASVDISSTEIRRRAAAGESISELVPQAVADYIAVNKLYR
jgi:nicotinate-nucleotide adenylyltransferase